MRHARPDQLRHAPGLGAFQDGAERHGRVVQSGNQEAVEARATGVEQVAGPVGGHRHIGDHGQPFGALLEPADDVEVCLAVRKEVENGERHVVGAAHRLQLVPIAAVTHRVLPVDGRAQALEGAWVGEHRGERGHAGIWPPEDRGAMSPCDTLSRRRSRPTLARWGLFNSLSVMPSRVRALRRGMTIIEVMFAIVILSGVMLAMSRFGQAFTRATRNAANLAMASDLAAARIEVIRAHGTYATIATTFDGAHGDLGRRRREPVDERVRRVHPGDGRRRRADRHVQLRHSDGDCHGRSPARPDEEDRHHRRVLSVP